MIKLDKQLAYIIYLYPFIKYVLILLQMILQAGLYYFPCAKIKRKLRAIKCSSIEVFSIVQFLFCFLLVGVQQVSIATGPLSEAYQHTMQARSIEEFSISIGLNRGSHMNNMKTIFKRICNETNIRIFFDHSEDRYVQHTCQYREASSDRVPVQSNRFLSL